MERFLDVLAVGSLLLLLVVLRSLRRSHFRVEHSVSWLAAAVALFALSRSPAFLTTLAGVLGLRDLDFTLIVVILVVFLGVFYRFSAVISQLKEMNITLTQRIAILEYRLGKINAEREEGSKASA